MTINGKWYSETETASLIETLKKENDELKKYLKLAVRDAGFYESEHCSCYHTSRCSHDCTDSEDCVFRYADKVEKLIGDTK